MKQIMLIFLILLVKAQIIFAAQVSIILKAQATVEPGVIRLGHIADIKGDQDLAKKISNIEVGKVAEPGRKTRVTENAIKGFFIKSVAGSQNATFEGAKFCDVIARSGQISADSLKALLLKEVRTRMAANLKEGKDWNLEAPKIPEKLATPESGGRILITLSPQFAGIGQEMATVQVFNGNKAITKQNFPFIVRRFEYAAELKKGIRKGEVIGEQDFEMVWQETTFQKRKILKKAEEVAGRTAIRTLKAGELLVDNFLDTPYAVKEGDVVKLFAKFGETVVQTNAIAQKSAFKGQTISVKNMDTGKSLLATISGSGEAWVN